MHYYSAFWLAGAALGAEWRQRDQVDRAELEAIPLAEWMRMPHAEHERILGAYLGGDGPISLPHGSGLPIERGRAR
jgi:hypothetical protein